MKRWLLSTIALLTFTSICMAQYGNPNPMPLILILESEITGVSNSVLMEAIRATQAEGVIATNLYNEITRSVNADNSLRTAVSNTTASLYMEINRAVDPENTLQTAISNEVVRAKSAETNLYNLIFQSTNSPQLYIVENGPTSILYHITSGSKTNKIGEFYTP